MTLVWAGLATGAIYSIVALTFTVVLTSSDVFNFAQPQFIMLGAFIGYWGLTEHAVPFVLVLLGAGLIGAAVGALEERIAIRPLKDRGGYAALVTTVGFSVALNGIAVLIWGATPDNVTIPYEQKVVTLLGGRIPLPELALIVISIVAALTLHGIARQSRWGMAGRAIAADPQAAVVRGVNAGRLKTIGFMIAGAFSMAVGVIIGGQLTANTDLGNNLVILGFVGMSVGGSGSYIGALIGGLLIGLIQTYTSRYIGSQYELIVLFGVLMAILLIRPTGLLGTRRLRAV